MTNMPAAREPDASHEPSPFKTILLGYSMRSGSTVLQHMLGHHSRLRSYGDITSYWMLFRLAAGWKPDYGVCVKPMDIVFLSRPPLSLYRHFNKFLWITRDPRDSYLSSVEAGYSYLFWLPGRKVEGIDVSLLDRWKRVSAHYFADKKRWHLIRYEDLVTNPGVLEGVFEYLELPFEDVTQFGKYNRFKGGDYKIRRTSTLHTKSVARHQRELSHRQSELFRTRLGKEMAEFGYLF